MDIEFKVGDRVTHDNYDEKGAGQEGTIVNMRHERNWVGIQFDQDIGGHSSEDTGRYGYCWNLDKSTLTLLKPRNIKWI